MANDELLQRTQVHDCRTDRLILSVAPDGTVDVAPDLSTETLREVLTHLARTVARVPDDSTPVLRPSLPIVREIAAANHVVYALRSDGVVFVLEPEDDLSNERWRELPKVPGTAVRRFNGSFTITRDDDSLVPDEPLPEPGKRDPITSSLAPAVETPEAKPIIDRLFDIPDDERFRLFDRLGLLPPRDTLKQIVMNAEGHIAVAHTAVTTALETTGGLRKLAEAVEEWYAARRTAP